jgi:hypothetical protein
VIEAAILLEAGWQAMVDEVWVVMVPRDEAKARLMERNAVTEQQAEQRIACKCTCVCVCARWCVQVCMYVYVCVSLCVSIL